MFKFIVIYMNHLVFMVLIFYGGNFSWYSIFRTNIASPLLHLLTNSTRTSKEKKDKFSALLLLQINDLIQLLIIYVTFYRVLVEHEVLKLESMLNNNFFLYNLSEHLNF